MTAVLGISGLYHDSAAALVVDGRIIAAAQEERFTRRKHDPALPIRAIEYCLQEGGLQVVHVHGVLHHVETELIRGTVGDPLLDPAACHPHRKRLRVVISTQASPLSARTIL